MGLGLLPDIIVCRSEKPLEATVRRKISEFCHVSPDHVVSVHDCSNIYHVPLFLFEQNVHPTVVQRLGILEIHDYQPDLTSWRKLSSVLDTATEKVVIALVGKYTKLTDSYLSVSKALRHACIHQGLKLELIFVESAHLQENNKGTEEYNNTWSSLEGIVVSVFCLLLTVFITEVHEIVIPGGFGERVIEGIIATANFARTKK